MAKRLTDEQIVSALIETGTVKGAAGCLGCQVKTLYARMRSDDFQRLYRMARGEILRGVTAKMQSNMSAAVDTLFMLMTDTDTPRQTRANCAATILQIGGKYTDAVDLLERIEALEAARDAELSEL